MNLFSAQLRREWFLLIQNTEEVLNPLFFLFLAISLFALATGGGPDVLRDYAPSIIWVLVLLANLLSLESLFRRDYEDGTLELLVLKAEPAFLALLAKVLVHWTFSGLAMTLLAPLAALILYLPTSALPTLMLSLVIGTPALSLIGAVGAALTVGLKRGGASAGPAGAAFICPDPDFRCGCRARADGRNRDHGADFMARGDYHGVPDAGTVCGAGGAPGQPGTVTAEPDPTLRI